MKLEELTKIDVFINGAGQTMPEEISAEVAPSLAYFGILIVHLIRCLLITKVIVLK